MVDYQSLLPIAIKAAEHACAEILEVYHSGDFQAEAKGDDSPLTLADKRAHGVIVSALAETQLPVLSEEGQSIPYEQRRGWARFWLVDPLDGTKEFLKRNGEFTVNIALIEKGKAVLGVVAVPVSGAVYYGSKGGGAYCKRSGSIEKLSIRPRAALEQDNLRVVASRSHMNDDTRDFLMRLRHPSLVSKGSSLKFMMLVEGEADIYPRFAPTMEWDTAAAHAVVNEVGLQIYQYAKDAELEYNKENLLNPYFLVR